MENINRLENIKEYVFKLLETENSGHGTSHIKRVYNLSINFAKKENANLEIVGLAALLHDIDDYKLVGKEISDKLINTREILNKFSIEADIQKQVIEIIKTMGYSKLLQGIRPKTLEGMIVSDADMCDGIGANGIIRSIVYSLSNKGSGIVFDSTTFPRPNITIEEYNNMGSTYKGDNAINHCFDKQLKLKGYMMTNSGKEEAIDRHNFMVEFLRHFFSEEDLPEWSSYLENYLKSLDSKNN